MMESTNEKANLGEMDQTQLWTPRSIGQAMHLQDFRGRRHFETSQGALDQGRMIQERISAESLHSGPHLWQEPVKPVGRI